MKILKYVALAIALLIVLFLVAMLLTPATHYETRVEVNRPATLTWRVLTDDSRMGEWLEGFKSIETLSGQPHVVGSRSAIATTNSVRGRGLFKPIMPLMKSSMVDRSMRGYERLKAMIEAEPGEPAEQPAAGQLTD
jgi:hypothetical protein